MITTNASGAPFSAAFEAAVSSTIVGYDLRLMVGGSALSCLVMRAQLDLGGAADSMGVTGFALGGAYSTRLTATLAECGAALEGREMEVQVGVDVGGSHEYASVAALTVSTVRVAGGVTTVEAFGPIVAKMGAAELGVAEGWASATSVASAIQTRSGVAVTIGAFTSADQRVWVRPDMSCRAALSALAFALGGFACEAGSSVIVCPLPRSATFAPSESAMTRLPSLSEADQTIDGLTVTALNGGEPLSWEFGTGRVAIEVEHADEAWARLLWGNVQGYAYRPGTLTMATLDPRVTPADAASVGAATVPATSVSATYDGGWFGTISSPGATAVSDAVGTEGPLSVRLDETVTAAQKATAAAARAMSDAASARQSAESAQESAEQALEDAATAKGAAEGAVADAADAKAAALRAASDASAAASSASAAASSASSAASDAADAQASATSAASDAAAARQSATNAESSATSAASSASAAQQSAADAATSASGAASSASSAASSATSAASSAAGAAQDAESARTSAAQAESDAADAKESADLALAQLSVVEDVAGTLSWISEHGSYVATTDTTVQEGRVYFELVDGDYVPVAQPSGNPAQRGWYVLDVTDSQSDYIMSHLAVTSAGLWVLPSGIGSATGPQTAAGYKMLLAANGCYIYDPTGALVRSDTASGTTFSSGRDWHVGGNDAYIFYDASEGTITIGGAGVLIGGTKTLDDLLEDVEQAQATAGAANSREQLIYRSAADGTTSMSATTTWVTDATGGQNMWTAVRPEYSRDYPVLFVATQRQTVTQSSGTACTCTTPHIDATTTVIDGGRVIANSITAEQMAANSILIGAIDESAQDELVSDVRDSIDGLTSTVDSNAASAAEAIGAVETALASAKESLGGRISTVEASSTTNATNITSLQNDLDGEGGLKGRVSSLEENEEALRQWQRLDADGVTLGAVGSAIVTRITNSAFNIADKAIIDADSVKFMSNATKVAEFGAEGMTLGDEALNHIKADQDELGFYAGAEKVAYMNANGLSVEGTVRAGDAVTIGGYQWHLSDARTRLDLLWIGED